MVVGLAVDVKTVVVVGAVVDVNCVDVSVARAVVVS